MVLIPGVNWQFTTASDFPDNTPPTVATLSPASQTSLLPLDQVFTLTFDELVQITDTEGIITIFSPAVGGGALTVDALTIANGGIELSDDGGVTTLTLTPTENLPGNTSLTFDIPSGLFEDLAGNPWGGISGFGTAWQVTTALGDTPCTSGIVDLEITFDNFPDDTSWTLTDQTGTVVDASPDYSGQQPGSTITTEFTNLADGTYTFTINDLFADGICCLSGQGSFVVSKNGEAIFSGGQFTTQQSFQFCIDASVDSELPQITCPTDIAIDAGANCSSAVTIVDPTATDNVTTSENMVYEGVRSDGFTLTDPFFVGETTITWTATDEAGNTSEACTQLITVNGTGDCWFNVGPELVGVSIENTIGYGVTINAEGNIAAYVQPNANGTGTIGNVIVLERSGNAWNPLGNAIPGGFGNSRGNSGIDLNDAGDRLAVSQDLGKVQVYQYSGSTWQPLGNQIPAAGQSFIQKVDFNASGDLLAVGYSAEQNLTGLVVVYELQGGDWVQRGSALSGDNASDYFGRDVSLNADGTRLAVGAYQIPSGFASSTRPGYARVFEWQNGDWVSLGNELVGDGSNTNDGDFFGISLNLNDAGDILVVGANAGDYAKVFQFQDNNWSQLGNNIPAENPFDQPGYQVDINGAGNVVLIGDFSQPARIFQWNGTQWQILGQPIYQEVGQDVAMNKAGNVVILGAPEANNFLGKVAIFEYAGSLDGEAPQITCPEPLLAGSMDGTPVPLALEDPTATDNETAPENITFEGTRSDGLELTDPFPLGETTITWTATDEGGNTSESCEQVVTVFQAETEAMFNTDGSLVINDINGGVTDDVLSFTLNGDNLVISSTSPIAIMGEGTIQVDANTVEIPLAEITGGISIDGQGGNDLLTIETPLSLAGAGNGLTLNNIDVALAGGGELQLDALSVTEGNFDTSGGTTVVATEANFFENGTLSGTGTLSGVVNMNLDSTLDPGVSPGILTVTGDLTLDNSNNTFEVGGTTPGTEHDQLIVNGTVTIVSGTSLDLLGGYANADGDLIVLISNDGTDPISGTFTGLEEGDEVSIGAFTGTITYTGGDGNDLVLVGETTVIEPPIVERDWKALGPDELNQPSLNGGQYADMALGPNDLPYVVSVNFLQIDVRRFNGNSWEAVGPPIENISLNRFRAEYTSIAISNTGVPYVLFVDQSDRFGSARRLNVKRYNGSIWEDVGPIGFGTGFQPDLAIDNNGVPYVVYREDDSQGKASVQRFNGLNWEYIGSPSFSENTISVPRIAIDAFNVPYVSYKDNGYSLRMTVEKFNGISWEVLGHPGISSGITGTTSGSISDSSISIDSNGIPYIAYDDYTNGSRPTVNRFNGTIWEVARRKCGI